MFIPTYFIFLTSTSTAYERSHVICSWQRLISLASKRQVDSSLPKNSSITFRI